MRLTYCVTLESPPLVSRRSSPAEPINLLHMARRGEAAHVRTVRHMWKSVRSEKLLPAWLINQRIGARHSDRGCKR